MELWEKIGLGFFVVVIIAAIALGIYFGVKSRQTSSPSDTQVNDASNGSSKVVDPSSNSASSSSNSNSSNSGTSSAGSTPIGSISAGSSTSVGSSTGSTSSGSSSIKNNLVCLQDVAKFQTGDSIFNSNNFNVNSLTSSQNQSSLQDYCSAGSDFYTNGCNVSLINPINSSGFRKFCCNNSVNKSDCNANSISCMTSKAKFATQAYSLSNFNDAALNNATNLNLLSNFCGIGNDIMANGCAIDENYPMNNATFRKYCCAGSTDRSKCGVENIKCLSNSGDFLQKDYDLQNFNLASISANADMLNQYCSLGIDMISSGCTTIANPLNSSTYRKLCCNNTTDINVCKNNQICLGSAGTFLTKDYDLQNINPTSIGANAAQVKAYCDNGITLQNNNCTSIATPINSQTFRKLCCNNSTNPSDCNSSALQCAVDTSDFANKTYDLQGVASYPPSIGANIDQITTMCNLGANLIKNCQSVAPANNNIYRQLCT